MPSPLLLWNHLETLLQRCIVHECCILFLDYDGTLAPIVEDPAAAQMGPAMQHVLTALAQHPRYRVGIVSGRALADLRTRVEGRGLYLAGNHGLEIEGPGISYEHPEVWRLRPELDALAQAMKGDLEAIPGAWVEDKGLTLSVHFRRVPAASVPEVKARLNKRAIPGIDAGRLALRTGKAVLEIRPRVQWTKAEAVRWILEQVRIERPAASRLALYLGDDDTDEDAFRCVLTGLPLLSCLMLSFTEGDSGLFPTLANYRLLLQDSQFALALRNTLWLTGLGVSLQLLTGLGVAMVLHKLILGRGLVRTIVLTPLNVPTIVAGVMFTYLFGSAGYLNEILHRLGAIDTPIDWLAGDWRSLGVILTADL